MKGILRRSFLFLVIGYIQACKKTETMSGGVTRAAAGAAKHASSEISRLHLVVKSYDKNSLNTFIRMMPGHGHTGFARLPTKIKRWTMNKSPHVHGKAKQSFELRTHSVLFPLPAPNVITLRWVDAIMRAGTSANVMFRVTVFTGDHIDTEYMGRHYVPSLNDVHKDQKTQRRKAGYIPLGMEDKKATVWGQENEYDLEKERQYFGKNKKEHVHTSSEECSDSEGCESYSKEIKTDMHERMK